MYAKTSENDQNGGKRKFKDLIANTEKLCRSHDDDLRVLDINWMRKEAKGMK